MDYSILRSYSHPSIAGSHSLSLSFSLSLSLSLSPEQAILDQWEGEIRKHVRPGTLSVLTYWGQDQAALQQLQHSQQQPQQGGASGSQPTTTTAPPRTYPIYTAADLAAADVVLTSYEVLRRDLPRDATENEGAESIRGSKRRKKKYPVSEIDTPWLHGSREAVV